MLNSKYVIISNNNVGLNPSLDDAKSTIYDEILTNIRQDSDNPAPAITRRDPATDPNQCSDLDKDNVACGMLVQSTPDVCKDDCIGRIICPITCGTCGKIFNLSICLIVLFVIHVYQSLN